ncbi:hypothetical protein BDQ17DRAFT_1357845 [Cyathus striatus]|nr:hypothetical protein BDQ17DRAFT_1357845 [Cyathus striatus]
MASSEGPTHLLSLKVMRVSRPALANAWQPFYSSSPSFSAYSSASILSLQGATPLPGHPKTLRDLTHASELLSLPPSFGSIQLGETFSSSLCVNNETSTTIEAVHLKVEMQTATSKVILLETEGPGHSLIPGDTLENVVSHEIKELGQHVLACVVTYRLPPNARAVPGASEDPHDPNLLTFRKFYKFLVTNPLSVKTKVHVPKSPSALLVPHERDKVFLEVHVQNLTQHPMFLERMRFECIDGWEVEEINANDSDNLDKNVFGGSLAIMQPQDMRQYIYFLRPKNVTDIPVVHLPGSVIPLGRLDISWTSSFGEPGRLLTSMLSRKIPAASLQHQPISPAPPAPALPPYLKRSVTIGPSRPQSPQLTQSRPATPPLGQRSDSPVHVRQNPVPLAMQVKSEPEIEVNLIVRQILRTDIKVETPFDISFTLMASSLSLIGGADGQVITLAIQHLRPQRISAAAPIFSSTPDTGSLSPRLPSSGLSTPSSATVTFNYALAHSKLLAASKKVAMIPDNRNQSNVQVEDDSFAAGWLPSPYFEGTEELGFAQSSSVVFVGPSLIVLPGLKLQKSEPSHDSVILAGINTPRYETRHDFTLSFIPLQEGFTTIGGVRILMLKQEPGKSKVARVLKEYKMVAEVWVSS